MKFKTKIVLTYLIILAAIVFLSSFTIIKAVGSRNDSEFLRNIVSISMAEMKQVKLDIVYIQQWLTDASASANLEGFDIAEKYYADANRLLDKDIKRKKDLGRDEFAKQLTDIKILLQEYYDVGKKMAHQYIDNGRKAGNVWMDKFDPLAEKLTGLVDKQAADYSEVSGIKLKELSENQNKIIQMLIAITAAVILILVSLGVYLSISFNQGIKLVLGYSDKLSNYDITSSPEAERNDEFGIAANRFRDSFEQLNSLIGNIKKSTSTTAGIKDSLVAAAEKVSETIVSIKSNTSALLKESVKMNGNLSDNVSAIEEITANISSIKDQIDEQVAMVEESTAAITEMISSLQSVDDITRKKAESVNRLVAAIKGGNDASAATDEKFQVDVIDKIDNISGMAESIQTIAAQTNLLSMNAAIEAAHAGDAGKGFAVVADEIRKLAETASKSSANITRIIKEIAEGIIGTGEVAQKKVDAFVVMNREIKETKNAFDEIVTSVQELNSGGAQIQEAMIVLQNVSSNIQNAASEMTAGAEQVIRGQLELKDISVNVSGGVEEIDNELEEIVYVSDEIVEYSSGLDVVIKDLKEETDKFSV